MASCSETEKVNYKYKMNTQFIVLFQINITEMTSKYLCHTCMQFLYFWRRGLQNAVTHVSKYVSLCYLLKHLHYLQTGGYNFTSSHYKPLLRNTILRSAWVHCNDILPCLARSQLKVLCGEDYWENELLYKLTDR